MPIGLARPHFSHITGIMLLLVLRMIVAQHKLHSLNKPPINFPRLLSYGLLASVVLRTTSVFSILFLYRTC